MNLLVTGAYKCTKEDLKVLSEMGNDVIFHQIEEETLPCSYEWVEGVICNGLFLHHKIDKFSNLKYIQLTSVGFDRVDTEYIKKKNIKLFNARGTYSIPIAEYVISGVLSIYKQLQFFSKNQTSHNWIKHRNLLELNGKTVLIVGFGNIGQECAKRFKAFGTKIYAVDMQNSNSNICDKFFSVKNLEDAIKVSDIIVLTLPLNDTTRQMFNAREFAWFKKEAILVNVSRGEIINQEDLISALKSQKLSGAVLDVFETEPLHEESPLWDMPNVIVTPHNSFVGENNAYRLKKLIEENLEMHN